MAKIKIYQIYYDEKSFEKLDNGFIPLDNSAASDKDWFEFEPILNYLNQSELDDDTWYGFLSPNFLNKTQVQSKLIIDIINNQDLYADVALIHTAWDQICYFKNPWEQGEMCHPGLKVFSQNFFDDMKIEVDLDNFYTDMTCSVFSNYIIAKKIYWVEWKKISNNFFHYMKGIESNASQSLLTPYGKYKSNLYPIKAFVQERFASLVLAINHFKVLAIDQSSRGPITTVLFEDNLTTRELLRKCDLFKNKYRQTKDQQFLKAYIETRAAIKFTPLVPK